MEAPRLEPDDLIIAPLERSMVKGAFQLTEAAHQNLIDWFRTAAVTAQEERKSKTYVAIDNRDTVIGYICLSIALPEDPIPGLSNKTRFNPQMVMIGKLYVLPEYRSAGIGTKLLEFAVAIGVRLDEMVGCIGLIVDSNNDDKTVNFYKRFGFVTISEAKRTIKMFFKIPEEPVTNPQPEFEL